MMIGHKKALKLRIYLVFQLNFIGIPKLHKIISLFCKTNLDN
jgi:hypothetical protein